MKPKVVVMAFDDGPHHAEDLYHSNQSPKNAKPKTTALIGVVCRGIQLLHVSESTIEVDGTDSTEKILQLILQNPFLPEIRLILIDSPTLGGFNPPNPFYLYEQTKIPLLLIPDRKPQSHIAQVYRDIFPQRTDQIEFLQKLPPLSSFKLSINTDPHITSDLYFHAIGIEISAIKEILRYLTHFSKIPEPLRIAHLIASRMREKR